MGVSVTPRSQPLENDKKVHIAEDQDQENKLRYGLKPELHFSFKVEWISGFDDNSDCHVYNTDDDWYFHL